nr:reverse transcriptase domain-containing protein [Tanacetum cinerariifolium]
MPYLMTLKNSRPFHDFEEYAVSTSADTPYMILWSKIMRSTFSANSPYPKSQYAVPKDPNTPYPKSTIFGEPPYPFDYPMRRLTMEEILVKFIDEARLQIPKYTRYMKSLLKNKSRLEEACMETKNKEDLAADHLSRFENLHMKVLTEKEIADKFSDEHLMALKSKSDNDEPWYVEFVNYIVGKVVPPNWTFEKRKRFFSQVKTYFWEEPYAFKLCAYNIMRRCVGGSETLKILAHCQTRPTNGHHSANITAKKVYDFGFYWPSIFKDVNEYVRRCDACQRSGNISSRNEMPQNNIQDLVKEKSMIIDGEFTKSRDPEVLES